MAEGFARAQGKSGVVVASAGLAAAKSVPPEVRRAMAEKGIDISAQEPKSIDLFSPGAFDVVINMSGHPIPRFRPTTEWTVPDPMYGSDEEYRACADLIEGLTRELLYGRTAC